jgi:hypothetical protein
MAFLKMRNPKLNPRYDGIATQYMRFGEPLGIRWDIAFYQMIVETGALRYGGDVKPNQNNFAGLGATGSGARGESFKDIETGVLAHLEHLLLYAGRPVANPVAERTRNVREWGVLDSWQASLTGPPTYSDLAAKWAPGSRSYIRMLQAIADHFHSALCRAPDPRPELLREARALIAAGAGKVAQAAKDGAVKVAEMAPPGPSGEELAKRAIEQAKKEGSDKRWGLGAKPETKPAAALVPYKVAGAPPSKAPQAEAKTGVDTSPKTSAKTGAKSSPPEGKSRLAFAGAAATVGAAGKAKRTPRDTALPPAADQKCRVWTASYGGQKALIIRSVNDQVVNFTVLDVNEGSESREADAFITAYAKNGKVAGEYPNQAQALDKAFELCPEG